MRVDMDEVWELLKPRELVLVIDAVEHRMRRLTVADARVIAEIGTRTDAQIGVWLASMFAGPAPEFVRRLGVSSGDAEQRAEDRFRAMSVIDALAIWYMSECSTGKKLDAVHAELARRLAGTAKEEPACLSE